MISFCLKNLLLYGDKILEGLGGHALMGVT
jgi:hypothetical protein